MKITLTKEEYFKTKLLFNAVSKDLAVRPSLTYVLLNAKLRDIVALNGHVIRIEKFYDEDRFIEITTNQLLCKTQFLLTPGQYKSKYGVGLIEIEIDPKLINDYPFPKYEMCIPPIENYEGQSVEKISFDFNKLNDIMKTFTKNEQKIIVFNFKGTIDPVLISKYDYDKKDYIVAGCLMPLRLFN